MASPALTLLSLGAGTQSTTLLLLAAEGRLPHRPQREVADRAGVPLQTDAELKNGAAEGCPPWTSRSRNPVQSDHDQAA